MDTVFVRFAIALLIGALIGLEREKSQRGQGGHSAAGFRTFILIAQAGAVAAWLSIETGSPWVFAGAGLACALFVLAGYVAHVREERRSIGLTTEFATVVVYLLGGATVYGHEQLAVALAIATSAVLAFRRTLHGIVERIGWDDIFAAIKLLIVVFIVLPVVPREPVDPWGALNLYTLTWLVILIAGLSFLGYVLVRWMGPHRGASVTGLVGGLASSTAVTLALSRRAASQPAAARALAAGILLAWAVMFVRVIVEAAVVNRSVAADLAWPMGTMAAIAAAGALVNLRGDGGDIPAAEAVHLKNPFSLIFALRFALLLAGVALLVDRAQAAMPSGGAYVVAAAAGLTDVDAVTLSMAERARSTGLTGQAVTAIGVAVLANTLVKTAMVVWLGGEALRRRVLPTAALVTAGAIVSILLVR
jgi:uncharacterized membrane protein (DUF4010 family)